MMQSLSKASETASKTVKKLDKFARFPPSKYMIGQFIALYKARKDPKLAKRIASEMIVDGVIDRASWPLTIAKFWMSVGIAALSGLALMFFILGAISHWTVAIPVIPLGGAVWGIIRVWKGINRGVENVTRFAKEQISTRTETLTEVSAQIDAPVTGPSQHPDVT